MQNLVKTIKLSRNQVIRALKTEPLKATIWIETNKKAKKICHVCAVGGVFHNLGMNATQIDACVDQLEISSAGTDQDLNNALDNGRWLSALSIKFENMAAKLARALELTSTEDLTVKQTAILKPVLIDWVNKNLPKDLGKVQVTKEFDDYEGKKVTRYKFAD